MSTKTKPYFKYKQQAVNSILDLAWGILKEGNVPSRYPKIVRKELEIYRKTGDMNPYEFQIKWRGYTILSIDTGNMEVTSPFEKLKIRNAITGEEWNSIVKAKESIFRYGQDKGIAWYFKCAVEEWYGNENELAFRSGSRWLRYAKAKES